MDTVKRIFFVFALAISSLFLPCSVTAQWTMCSGIPDSVQLRVPLKDGSQLMAGTAGGYYSSSDGGLNWAKQTPATLPSTFHIADIMRFHRYLFGYGFDGIYRSADSGLTWQLSTNIYAFAMYGMGGRLIFKNNSNDYYSDDTGATWISVGGGSGTYNINIYTRSLLYPYVSVDTALFLEFSVLGFYRSLDSGRTYNDFGLNGMGNYNSFTQIDNRLFAAANLDGTTTIKNVYSSSAATPTWQAMPNNADGQFYWLSGTDHHMLLGSTQDLPYYSTNYLSAKMSWTLLDTNGLHLGSEYSGSAYYSISFVKDYGDFLLMGVNYYNASSSDPLIPVKNVYFTRRMDNLFPTSVPVVNANESQTEFNVATVSADHNVKYSLKLPVSSHVKISLTDMSGNGQIMILDKMMGTDLSVSEYPVDDLPPGIYLVTLETSDTKMVRRLVLTH